MFKGLNIVIQVANKSVSNLTPMTVRDYEKQSCKEMITLFKLETQIYSVSHTFGNVAIGVYERFKRVGIGVDLEILEDSAIFPLTFREVLKQSLREAIFKSINNSGGECKYSDCIDVSDSKLSEEKNILVRTSDFWGRVYSTEAKYRIIFLCGRKYILSCAITTSPIGCVGEWNRYE